MFIMLLICFHLLSLQGMLLPPHNVTLTSENFHIFLRWEPGHGSHSGNQYEVESCSRYVIAQKAEIEQGKGVGISVPTVLKSFVGSFGYFYPFLNLLYVRPLGRGEGQSRNLRVPGQSKDCV